MEMDLCGDYVFEGCKSLETVVIGRNCDYIDDTTFKGCEKLAKIVIGGRVDEIRARAFEDFKNLVSVEINKACEIGDFAFKGCEQLMAVTLQNPSYLHGIGNEAFKDCKGLLSIRIPEGVRYIGDYAFENAGCPEYEFSTMDSEGRENKVFISGDDDLLIIPESVKTIGEGAFKNCQSLKLVHIDSNCEVEEIPKDTFRGCKNLEQIIFSENIKWIGDEAFYDCSLLDSMEVPSSVETLGHKTFGKCTNLRVVLFNGDVQEEEDTFYDCDEIIKAKKESKPFSLKSIKKAIAKVFGKKKEKIEENDELDRDEK